MSNSFRKYMDDPKILSVILAAYRVCHSITEEQMNSLQSACMDEQQSLEFHAAMYDLGFAVQELEE